MNTAEKVVKVEHLLRVKYPVSWAPRPIESGRHAIPDKEGHELHARMMAQIDAERLTLLATADDEIERMYQAAMTEEQARAALKASIEDKGRFFNRREAQADASYWGVMGSWTLEESVALLLGREPTKVNWSTVFPYAKVSDFAKQYERLRNLALRAPEFGYGQHTIEPVKVIAWATDIGHSVPLDLATCVAARESKRLSRELAGLSGNLASQERPAQAGAAAPHGAPNAKSADEIAAMNWGYLCEELKRTPGQRAALLLEYMRGMESKAGGQVPISITIGGRRFAVSADLIHRLALIPEIDAALFDATNPRASTASSVPQSAPSEATTPVRSDCLPDEPIKRRAMALEWFREAGGKRPKEGGKPGKRGALARVVERSKIDKDTLAAMLDKAIEEKRAADAFASLAAKH